MPLLSLYRNAMQIVRTNQLNLLQYQNWEELLVWQSGSDPGVQYVRGSDVLDIWFDSGVSWASVLKG